MYKRRNNKPKEDFWKSFADLFTTLCLAFFFVTLIVVLTSASALSELPSIEEYENYEENRVRLEEDNKKLEDKLKDYQNKFDNIAKTRADLYANIESNLKLVLGDKVKSNAGKIDINTDVWFDTNSDSLTETGIQEANLIGKAFINLLDENEKRLDGLKIEFIEVRGHTDNVDTGEYNRSLSVRRATSFVNQIFRTNGVEDNVKEDKYAKYFKASGMSKYEPISGDIYSQTDADRSRNRRIEIYIQMNDADIYNEIIKLYK
ncbi:hypothetical protein AGMMS49975_16350 [Clostridia bacterium]|nr:hypothetical protein AGMMS49975_16350 [Clostridia bacterium]